jgi:hypothetical protein
MIGKANGSAQREPSQCLLHRPHLGLSHTGIVSGEVRIFLYALENRVRIT